VKYDEVHPKDWEKLKSEGIESGLLPFGQIPLLQHGDFSVVQSNSIIRYLGRTLRLGGSNKCERTRVDQLLDAAEELRVHYARLIYTHKLDEKEKEAHKTFTESQVANIEKWLKRTKTDYLIAKEFSVADAAWFDLIDIHLRIYKDLLDSSPTVREWHKRVGARPKIDAYLKSTRRPQQINGNGLG